LPAAGGDYKTMAAKSSRISGVRIEKLIYGGDGLAHHDGSTVFVPFVLPEERVAAEVVEQKKKFVRAQLDSVTEPSPARMAARCPHFGVCGGCHYQHIPYEAQLKYKTEILRETLRRIGHIDWPGEIRVQSAQPWGYRNRAQWKVRPLGDSSEGGSEAMLGIGYFEPNSTSLCAVQDCPILAPPLLEALLALRAALAAGGLPRALREIEAFASPSMPTAKAKLLLTATFAGFPSRASELAEKIRAAVPHVESLLLHDPSHERMELFGPGFIEYEMADAKYRVGHFSFFQVNDLLVADLAAAVAGTAPADANGGNLALDLYAGVGLFALPLAQRFGRVIAVESNPAAARDLESNTRGHGAIDVRNADVERFLQQYKEKERPDLVVLDPPRAGLAPAVVNRLLRLAPSRICYVSCEPPTLARDLKVLREGGYEISGVELFDLFPQAFHIETLVRLEKRA
jgi:23S rRNA (uracil1939-C5)-methyltransferase